MSVAVLTIIAPLFAMLILSFLSLMEHQHHSKEWDLFVIQFQEEIAPLMLESHTDQSVTFIRGNTKVVFSKYGSVLRKTVNGTGYEIHLTAIDHLTFSRDGKMVMMGVQFKNGETKKSIFYTNDFE